MDLPQTDKRLLTIAGTDGCASDGIAVATNCWVGPRTMRVEAPTPDKRPVEPPTQEQVRKLLEVLEGDRLYPLYVVFLGAGLRRGEALVLTKDCIDWEEGLIHVRKSIQSIKGGGWS